MNKKNFLIFFNHRIIEFFISITFKQSFKSMAFKCSEKKIIFTCTSVIKVNLDDIICFYRTIRIFIVIFSAI